MALLGGLLFYNPAILNLAYPAGFADPAYLV